GDDGSTCDTCEDRPGRERRQFPADSRGPAATQGPSRGGSGTGRSGCRWGQRLRSAGGPGGVGRGAVAEVSQDQRPGGDRDRPPLATGPVVCDGPFAACRG